MNNLPNIERKCRNVDSFLAFLLFVCLLFTTSYGSADISGACYLLNRPLNSIFAS